MNIRHQVLMDVKSPPTHWKTIQEGTLVAHPREGEHRFDYVYYDKDTVTFLETTVSQYWDTKVPSMTAAGQSKLLSIQSKIAKWIGADRFTVKVDGHRLIAVPTLTSSAQKRKRGSSASGSPLQMAVPPPALKYVILSPRPAHTFTTARAKHYGFIGVCHDECLSSSAIVSLDESRSFVLGGCDDTE